MLGSAEIASDFFPISHAGESSRDVAKVSRYNLPMKSSAGSKMHSALPNGPAEDGGS